MTTVYAAHGHTVPRVASSRYKSCVVMRWNYLYAVFVFMYCRRADDLIEMKCGRFIFPLSVSACLSLYFSVSLSVSYLLPLSLSPNGFVIVCLCPCRSPSLSLSLPPSHNRLSTDLLLLCSELIHYRRGLLFPKTAGHQ